ncbi:MAG TPA: MerR family transcriptional regulator, partial [Acidimicrobiales bacterium]|nr:MerR family transcriptional regulator [Acidimicrobiales bacterium]
MGERSYLSIGEVLTLLKEEFPDVTISKIRFLESQGLLDPERTPSGYRKFYDTDVERLRWILRQQREHFLPLKVIKGRLRVGPEGIGPEGIGPEGIGPEGNESGGIGDEASDDAVLGDSAGGLVSVGGADGSIDVMAGQGAGVGSSLGGGQAEGGQLGSRQHGHIGSGHIGSGHIGSGHIGSSDRIGSEQPLGSGQFGTSGAQAAPATVGGAGFPGSMGNYLDLPPLPVAHSGVSLTLDELSGATGLDDELLKELEKFGLLSGRKVASSTYYDEDALNVATIAAGFMKYGVEARHLRMYKTAGEREAGFFEQVVMPMLKQRNPQARRQATEALAELSQLGQGLRTAMLRQ